MMSLSSGAGQLFGSTGGVMEAAVRTMSAVKNQDPRPMPPLTPVRGMEFIKEATVRLGDLGDIRIAVVHECANIAKVIEMVRNGTCPYHFVEVMALSGRLCGRRRHNPRCMGPQYGQASAGDLCDRQGQEDPRVLREPRK